MSIDYKITKYFEDNNLFDSDKSNGITIKQDVNTIMIKGNPRDLVELADLLANVAASKEKYEHIHIDELTLLNAESDFSDIIIEKID